MSTHAQAVHAIGTVTKSSAHIAVYRGGRLYPAALLTAGAAAIHFAVVPEHLHEYWPFGIFFLLLGVAQIAVALATLLLPNRLLFAGAAAGTLAVLTLWVVSRTTGLPISPLPGRPEMLGAPDLMTAVLEAVAVLLFGLLTRPPRPLHRSARPIWRVVRAGLGAGGLLLTTLLIGIVTTVGVGAALNPMPDALNMGSAVPGRPAISVNSLKEAPGVQPVKSFTLTAAVGHAAGQEVWAYNGTVPGPELRVRVGDRLRVTLINHLPAATSIHWHGVRLPNAEDGVVGVTQDAVPPGGTFTYEFVVKDAGTYWYHSHQDTMQQVPRGLYGALIVDPPDGPHYDRDYVVALGNLAAGFNGRFTVNGSPNDVRLAAQPGELVRLRVINAVPGDMAGSPELLTLTGAPYTVIALDGHDLHEPQVLGPLLLPVGAGQRYDLAFRMPAGGQVRLLDAQPAVAQPTLRPIAVSLGEGVGPAQPNLSTLPTFDLTSYGTPAPDPIATHAGFDVSADLHIQSAAGFRDGTIQLIHRLNGQAAPDTAPVIVHIGQVVRLRFINETNEYHPMHLHGHIFAILSKNARPLTGSPVHVDAVLVGPHETWEVAFPADNPGLWMLHCHVLLHAAMGLDMMVNYADIATPYTMGTLSGNISE